MRLPMRLQTEKIGITYGMLSEPVEDQLKSEGYTLGPDSKRIKKILNALYTLRIELQLPDSMYHNILQRVHKQILKHIKPRR